MLSRTEVRVHSVLNFTETQRADNKVHISQGYNSMIFTTKIKIQDIFFFFLTLQIVLVLPNIKMNPPQVYMCSPS